MINALRTLEIDLLSNEQTWLIYPSHTGCPETNDIAPPFITILCLSDYNVIADYRSRILTVSYLDTKVCTICFGFKQPYQVFVEYRASMYLGG